MISIILLSVVIFCIPKIPAIKRYLSKIKETLESYWIEIPWMLRLSLGIALIGAGTAQVLISPLLPFEPAFSSIQIILGFLLLAGFLITPATIATILLYFVALLKDPYLLGNVEFFFGAVALLAFSSPRPGVDDILGIKMHAIHGLRKFVPFILRMGVGGAMLYLALHEKIFNPHISELVVNQFNLTSVINVPPAMWVAGAGIVEGVIALLIIFGYKTRFVSTLAFLVITLTFFAFKEDVYSHITLFGIFSALISTGGGHWSIDNWKKKTL